MSYDYNYNKKETKKSNTLVTVRDYGENALLEVERKGDTVEIVTRRNEKTSKFTLPIALFEQLYQDITEPKNK